MTRDVVVVAVMALVAGSATASAQSATSSIGRVELSVGAGLLGGAQLGERAADLRAGGSGGPFRLFDSESELARSGLVEARAGVRVTSRYTLEARVALSRPDLRTTVSSDLEAPPVDPLAEQVKQYAFDGGVRMGLGDSAIFGLAPFVSAGAGYLRQLHENDALVDEGHYFYAGGGMARWLVIRSGMLRGVGVRADARLYLFSGGDSLSDDGRQQGAISGSFVVAF
jgi:hypothetical protein